MLEVEIWSVAHVEQGDAILLRPLGSDTVVPIFIGHIEAHAILLGLGDVKTKHPLTCDLLLEVSRHLGLSLFRVEVCEIREDTFYARLFFSGREYSRPRPLIIDSRPSDAIALAIREKCAVYVASQVLDQAGVPAEVFIEDIDNSGAAGTPQALKVSKEESGEIPQGNPLAVKRHRLRTELELAVEEEAYERAAEIRDILILLDQQLEQER
ncbi:MAG: bifunctional nuclease family protein [Treponema sp.]|jgi:bifunctional DNase/RNase|nr:bifunctional nuclease family protein [Treponema sp.]